MSASQKTHNQKHTAQHTSVAGNIHSQKGISMPAVPVLQEKKEESEEQAYDNSYSSLSMASDNPETIPVSAFVPPAQKKQSIVSPVQRFEIKGTSLAQNTDTGVAQFKTENPVQLEGKICQTAGEVNLLGVPDGPVMKVLPAGTMVKSMAVIDGGWAHVNVSGEMGYVKNDSITPI